MKLYSSRKQHRRLYVRAIKHAERFAARMMCLRWMRGEQEAD